MADPWEIWIERALAQSGDLAPVVRGLGLRVSGERLVTCSLNQDWASLMGKGRSVFFTQPKKSMAITVADSNGTTERFMFGKVKG